MKIRVKGIKSLTKDTLPIEFKPITLITGRNSAGKTTFTSSLKMLSQALFQPGFQKIINLPDMPIAPDLLHWDGNRPSEDTENKALPPLIYSIDPELHPGFHYQIVCEREKTGYRVVRVESFMHKQKVQVISFQSFDPADTQFPGPFGLAFEVSKLPKSIWGLLGSAVEVIQSLAGHSNVVDSCIRSYVKDGHCNKTLDAWFLEASQEVLTGKKKQLCTEWGFRQLVYVTGSVLTRLKQANSTQIPGLMGRDVAEAFMDYSKSALMNLKVAFSDQYDRQELDIFFENGLGCPDLNPEVISRRANYSGMADAVTQTLQTRIANYLTVDEDAKPFDSLYQYLSDAEGFEAQDYPLEDGDQIKDGRCNPNSMMLAVVQTIQLWYEVMVWESLVNLADLNFPERPDGQPHYFISGQKSVDTLEAIRFFTGKKIQEIPLNAFKELYGKGHRLELEEHLAGNAHMLYLRTADGQRMNIADLGSGEHYLLRLYILIQYYLTQRSDFFKLVMQNPLDYPIKIVLTEPETHLHPSLQAALARYLVYLLAEKNIQFMIETHSEPMIRALQVAVAKRQIKPEECIIYYFEKSGLHTRVKSIEIDSHGMLVGEFGAGFLDESEKLLRELRKLADN